MHTIPNHKTNLLWNRMFVILSDAGMNCSVCMTITCVMCIHHTNLSTDCNTLLHYIQLHTHFSVWLKHLFNPVNLIIADYIVITTALVFANIFFPRCIHNILQHTNVDIYVRNRYWFFHHIKILFNWNEKPIEIYMHL